MTLKITALILVATLALLLVIVPAVRAWAREWWEPTFHKDKRTAEQKAADELEQKEWLTELSRSLAHLECLKSLKTEYLPDRACGTPSVEEQLQRAREYTSLAEQGPPCKLKDFTGGIIYSDEYERRCNTNENILRNMTTTTNTTTTEDDGYTYPNNAVETEKAKIDSQERYEWEEAGRPGEIQHANPYCDLLSAEQRSNIICHDRKDASDITELYTCNDGTHEEDWLDCKVISGYDYGRRNNE